ncbi:dihydrofolate reductase family protein [Rudanella lutea]|uniref:dihydrofolate reductase family protein n=1 Tax=Rudanella lutea TaxID=451374 RepID=UPI00035EAF6C|nr:dihydrofolate reductase family protein [Rudanella lutea]
MTSTPNISVFIATSLDGFIARTDGAIDWLTHPDYQIDGEDFGYQSFMDSVDMIVMGRNTYETVLGFGGEWPYRGKRMVILSSKQPAIPPALAHEVEVTHLPPAELVAQLSERGVRQVYLDGGLTIQGFLAAGLVHELTITRIPVLLGEGIPLFGATGHDIALHHTETRTFPNGFVQSRYTVRTA